MFSSTTHTKPIPRTALYTPTSPSPSPSPSVEAQLHAGLARVYSPSTPPTTTTTTTTATTNASHRASSLLLAETPPTTAPDEAQSYEFRLFSTPNANAPPIQKVIIRSPTPPPYDAIGGFVVPHRGLGYYFSSSDAAAETRKRRREYKDVALTGQDVLKQARIPWPGCTLPWRVTTLHLPTRHRLPPIPSSTHVDGQRDRRKRPGKKRRLAVHKALAARQAVVAAREAEAKGREVAEREKRTRRNREKKVKRKMKGKVAKMEEEAGKGAGGEGEGG